MTVSHRRGVVAAARRGERGSVLLVVALSLTVIVTCTALTIDLGRVSTARRDLQNVADAVALDLVRLVDGRTATEVVTDPRWADTLAASLDRNAFVPGGDRSVVVAVGSYDAVAEEFTVVTGTAIPRAVRVIATDRVHYQLVPGGATTSRQAVASQGAVAGIQVGSFAARLDSERSALLQGLLGDALDVSAVSYEGLAGASIGLDALATELGLSLGSPDELLATEVGLADLLSAQADILRRGGDVARANLLDQLALALPDPGRPVALGDVLTVVAGGEDAASSASLDVLELLTATALTSNGSGFLSVPQVGLALPGGILTQTARLSVTEPPAVAFGPVGTTARTAQVRLESTVQVDVPLVGTATVRLAVDVASATATIADIGCASPQRLGVDVTTGVAQARADVTARVLGLGGVAVADAVLHADTAQGSAARAVDFVVPPDVLGEPRTYTAPVLDLAGATVVTDDVDVLGIPLGPPVGTLVTNLVSTVVGPLIDQLDALLVQPLLDLLGVAANGADLTPLAITCGDRGLVA